jgi:hypothetical protein
MNICEDCIHYDVCLGAFGDCLYKTCDLFEDKSKFIDCLYIIPTTNKPIKVVFENEVFVEDNGDTTLTISRPATLKEIAEWFDISIDELLNTKFGICSFSSDNEEVN